MKNRYYFSLSLFLVICFFITIGRTDAQPWMSNLTPEQSKNFYNIQRAANQYWQGKNTKQKGNGWKPWKRWEWFWEQRTAPTGQFPQPGLIYKEIRKQKVNGKKSIDKTQTIGEWLPLGPTTSPGGYNGLGRINCVRQHPTVSTTLYAGAASGGLWVSTNSGTLWTTYTDELASIGITDLVFDPTNPSIMYLATGDGDAWDTRSVGVLKSTNGGATWNTTGLNWTQAEGRVISRLIAHPTDGNIYWAAGSNGIYKTTNAGATWTQTLTNVEIKDMEIQPGTPTVLYAAGTSFYKSTDGGSTWTQITSGFPSFGVQRVALAVTAANTSFVYALVSNTNSAFLGLYRSTDSGENWTTMSTTPNILGWNQDGSGTDGQGWYDLCLAANPLSENEIYAGGINIWKSTNGGAEWFPVSSWTSNVHADQHDLWFVPNSSLLYAGNDGGVYKTTNTGTNWIWIGATMQITQFYKLGCSATNQNLVIGGSQDNGTKLRNGANWSDVIGGDGMECLIDYSNSNYMFGELYYGQIRKSTNGGLSFYDMTLPSEFNDNLGAWVTPFVQHPTDPQTLYVGYRNIWKTTDRGSSWTQISNFTSSNMRLIQIAPSNPDVIYICNNSNVFYRSDNGGTSWSQIALPTNNSLTYVAVHQSNPLTIWASFSGYTAGVKVFYSSDGGVNWTNISGSLPNVPVNCIVYQNNYYNRVYAGTDIGVYYKDNTTTDWVLFSDNLPNVPIDELEIHYASSKLRAATYGRGLWEAEIPLSPIITGAVPVNICPGQQISVPFTILTTFNSGNIFTAQLSDANGNFASPTVIGFLASTTAGTITAYIPSLTPSGRGYRIRVVSSSPVVTGMDNSANIIIAPLSTDELSVLTYFAGDELNVAYSALCPFNSGNVFTAQLSNADGDFSSPATIGSIESNVTGSIQCTIPEDAAQGFAYRIRVNSSSPSLTGLDNNQNISICGMFTEEHFDLPTMPSCIQNISVNLTGPWDIVSSGTYPTCMPHSAGYMATYNSFNYSSNTSGAMILPPFAVEDDNDYSFSFWMYRDNGYSSYADKVEIFINNAYDIDGATLIGTVYRSTSLSPAVTSNGWYQYIFPIDSDLLSERNFIIVKGTSQYGNNIYIDDLEIMLIPVITLDNPSVNNLCGGSTVDLSYQVSSQFEEGNQFILQLSNALGEFNLPINLASIESTTSGIISAEIPVITNGSHYRLRLVSTNPPATSNKTDDYNLITPIVYHSLTENSYGETTGVYSEISGVLLGNGDDETYNIAMPFDFIYDGQVIQSGSYISACTNGWLSLVETDNTSWSLSITSLPKVIAWAAEDLLLTRTGSNIQYNISGTEPERILTVQWKYAGYYGSNTENLNAQIILHEGSNRIEILYGTVTNLASGTNVGVIGFTGASQSNNYINIQPGAISTFYNGNLNPNTTRLLNSSNAQYIVPNKIYYVEQIIEMPEGVLYSPENGAAGVELPIELLWQDVCADSYELQIATDEQFSSIVLSREINGSNTTEITESDGLLGNTQYYWRVRAIKNEIISDWYAPFNFTTLIGAGLQTIPLKQGWNLISSYVNPESLLITDIFSPMLQQKKLLMIKNELGLIFCPAFQYYAFADWDVTKSFWLYSMNQNSVTFTGSIIQPNTPIYLNAGWNYVPYYPQTAMYPQTALASILSYVLVVANYNNERYYPLSGVNTLEYNTEYQGMMLPGRGYIIYVTIPATLIYPSN
jgi:photosystem II stability/assembly factor-like uncharacterized protein